MPSEQVQQFMRAVAEMSDSDLGAVARLASRPEFAAQTLLVARGGVRRVVAMLDEAAKQST